MKKTNYYKKFTDKRTMNIAEDKGKCSNLLTQHIDHFNSHLTNDIYKRDSTITLKDEDGVVIEVVANKKGDIKRKYSPVFTKKFDNIIEAWKSSSEFLQTSAGLNHTIRNVIYLDFDIDAKLMKNEVLEVCRKNNFPQPTFITKHNKLSKDGLHHGDAMWVFNKNVNSEALNDVRKEFTKLFPNADKHFTGWQIKNPFNENITIIGGTQELYAWKQFVDLNIVKVERHIVEQTQITITHSRGCNNASNSRNQYIYNEARNIMFRYKNTHDGQLTYETAYNLCYSLIESASALTGKKAYPLYEFKQVIKCVYNFVNEKWDSNYCRWTSTMRLNSLQTRQMKMFANAVQAQSMQKDGKKKTEIADIIGVTRKNVYELLALSADDLKELFLKAQMWIEAIESDSSTQTMSIQKYIETIRYAIELYKRLYTNNLTPSKTTLYYNTKVTHYNNELQTVNNSTEKHKIKATALCGS